MNTTVRAAELTALLSEAPTDATDHEAIRKFIHQMAEAGLAVMFVLPGSKVPADMRSPQRKSADDRAAQAAARGAGRGGHKVKSPSGLALATTEVDVLDGYLDRYIRTFSRWADADGSDVTWTVKDADTLTLVEPVAVNLAVELSGSGLVVVDADTAAQTETFMAEFPAEGAPSATVATPGAVGSDGDPADPATWAHADGGHWWFTVPEGAELPTTVNTAKLGEVPADDRYVAMWGRCYVVIPPSVRPEGVYAVAGGVSEAPDWLADKITDAARRGAERDSDGAALPADAELADRIDAWAESVTWAAILEPMGWAVTGKPDGCGCPTWTAPGVHASPKSATAHEAGCTAGRYTVTNAPLHIWTDNPGEPFEGWATARGKPVTEMTISKLQAVTAHWYGDDLGEAMSKMGITDSDALAVPEDLPADFGSARKSAKPVTDDGTCLPDEFWTAHPALAHIRQFAHYGVNSADAVLGAALTRLSAHLDPCVRIDTGVKRPLPLNTFAGIVGSAGTGKSSAFQASADLLDFEFGDPMTGELVAPADEQPPELSVGSGPGVAEAFMGTVPDPTDPKIKYRRQVRHKVLFQSDEGAGLVSGILDNKRGQDIGPTLRAAWTGAVLGQANASAERTRQVRDYSVGLCVGFQLEALAAMSTDEQLEYGTPQRFVYFSATDPSIPDDAPDDPGPLRVTLPHGPLRYDAELRARARKEALARARGDHNDRAVGDLMLAHRPALVARCAALLVVLCDPGRTEIHAADVELAEMLLDTSARLHGVAMEWRREREASERDRQLKGRISEQVATAVALDGRADDMKRLGDRIKKYLADAGGSAEWGGRAGLRKGKFDNSDRQLADAALRQLESAGDVRFDGNLVIAAS